ncbi:MAG: hypothetical protein PQ612_06500 [Rickettsiales bacterium]|nr:hypothetical protein [Pseudomonadota bacterium]MDA0966623.1 hypothetical protein [Pseudomonadota bacterium]MDG4543651.1 hypothetical protein [Rickettsiales bacterium]MDG4545798.1 hypothetical protein [Rickettsiales bacterium]MDG4547428.1 hypothetical protein [Rickettsiales bacterium]
MSNRGDIYLSDWLVRKRRSFKRDQEQKLQQVLKLNNDEKGINPFDKQPSFFKKKANYS